MRRLRDQALVVQRRVLGESDRLVELLCRRHGKLSAVAPAGRASRKRFGGCLELFARIEVELVDKGRGGLWRLESASLLCAHPGIRTDLVAVAHAGYLTELTCALLKEGEQVDQAFDLLAGALARLDRGPLAVLDLRSLEFSLLVLFGVAPLLDACSKCAATRSGSWTFDLDGGGLVCDRCPPGPRAEPIDASVRELLLGLQAGSPAAQTSPQTLATTRGLLARIIDEHVGRPLKAREFLRQLAAETQRQE